MIHTIHSHSSMTRGLASAAASLTLAISLTACSSNRLPDPADPTGPETVGPVGVEPTTETTPTDTETLSPGEGEVFEQTTSIEAMEAMTLEEFAKLSYADRAAYTYTIAPYLKTGSAGQDFDALSIPGFYWDSTSRGSFQLEDSLQRAKAISALYYYATDQHSGEINAAYAGTAAQWEADQGTDITKVGNLATQYVYANHGQTQTGTDRDGNPITYTNITYTLNDRYSGELLFGPRTAQVFEITTHLEDGRTIVTYPVGYQVEGEQSPVEGGSY